jgi:N-acetylneuraminic acid mutarotase
VEIYDPATNEWSAAAPLAQPRYAFTLEQLPDGQVITVGGAHDYDNAWTESSFIREIEGYDARANRWYLAGELPQPITYAATAFLPDGRLWVSGGGAGHAVATAWADTWLITPAMTQP